MGQGPLRRKEKALSIKVKVKLLLLGLVLVLSSLPLSAWTKDPGTGGGTSCSSSCARQCANGYWSSIGCLPGQCAYCPCGNPPYPYCV